MKYGSPFTFLKFSGTRSWNRMFLLSNLDNSSWGSAFFSLQHQIIPPLNVGSLQRALRFWRNLIQNVDFPYPVSPQLMHVKVCCNLRVSYMTILFRGVLVHFIPERNRRIVIQPSTFVKWESIYLVLRLCYYGHNTLAFLRFIILSVWPTISCFPRSLSISYLECYWNQRVGMLYNPALYREPFRTFCQLRCYRRSS
jgi:hypothetical protein